MTNGAPLPSGVDIPNSQKDPILTRLPMITFLWMIEKGSILTSSPRQASGETYDEGCLTVIFFKCFQQS